MPPRPQDVYNPTATVTPSTAAPNDYLTVRANPDQMGAQVGGALKQAGAQMEQSANEGMQVALQQQGILNESAATDADVKLSQVHGELSGQYRTLKGFDAVNARDAYMEKVQQARETMGANLNPAARRAYDMLSARTTGYVLRDMGDYAATQINAAHVMSANASIANSQQNLASSTVANDPNRIAQNIGDIKFGVASLMHSQSGFSGAITQDDKGNVSFADTDEGKQAQQVYQNLMNEKLDTAYKNIYKTLATDTETGSIVKAVNWLQSMKGKMPASTYAELSYTSNKTYRSYQGSVMAEQGISQALGKYHAELGQGTLNSLPGNLNPDDFKTLERTPPGVTSSAGAVSSYQITPIAAKDVGFDYNKIATDEGYAKQASQAIADKLAKLFPNDMVAQAVGYNAGPTFAAKWVADGSNFSELKPETQDYVKRLYQNKGVQQWSAAPDAEKSSETPWIPPVDYLRMHSADIAQQTYNNYISQFPGDNQGAEAAAQHTSTLIRRQVMQQEETNRANVDSLLNKISAGKIQSIDDPNLDSADKKVWQDVNAQDPLGVTTIRNYAANMSKGQGKTFGAGFYNLYADVAEGKITDSNQLGSYLHSIDNNPDHAPLTNNGFKYLKDLISKNQDPKEHSIMQQTTALLDTLHGVATGGDFAQGVVVPQLEQQFNAHVPAILSAVQDGLKAGKTPAQLFNKTNPDGSPNKDYVGNMMPAPDQNKLTKMVMAQQAADMKHTREQKGAQITISNISSQDDFEKAYLSSSFGKPGTPEAREAAGKWLDAHKNLLAPAVPGIGQ